MGPESLSLIVAILFVCWLLVVGLATGVLKIGLPSSGSATPLTTTDHGRRPHVAPSYDMAGAATLKPPPSRDRHNGNEPARKWRIGTDKLQNL
jgi:hypothetical protein